MNIFNNKRFFILPIVIIVSLIFSSFLFFNQIDKLKKQIDNLYFGTFIPVHKLHNIVNIYDKAIYINKLLKKDKKKISEGWNYYYKSYKTNKEKAILKKIDLKILKSFKRYDSKLFLNIVLNINNIIEYEVNVASSQRKVFLEKYKQMNEYLKYSLIIILLMSLALVAYIIYLSLQKHTELEKLTNKYKIDSITDGLTNLYNRKHFDLIFSKMTIIAKENNWKCAFVMLDIDFFKPFNDTYGHDMGDMVIKSVANTLRKSFNKQYEYIFRIGGEEFGVIIFDITISKLKKSLDNLQLNIKNLQIPHTASATGYLTISMGVTLVDNNSINKEIKELYKAADDKLYHSKENGRDQYTI
ncbi:MAG: GGDEF domain-containing protein [Arcobacteraceae bacterium]|nr:GGDEF domain-containing protein [Arcobacteraceae bacterium]